MLRYFQRAPFISVGGRLILKGGADVILLLVVVFQKERTGVF